MIFMRFKYLKIDMFYQLPKESPLFSLFAYKNCLYLKKSYKYIYIHIQIYMSLYLELKFISHSLPRP